MFCGYIKEDTWIMINVKLWEPWLFCFFSTNEMHRYIFSNGSLRVMSSNFLKSAYGSGSVCHVGSTQLVTIQVLLRWRNLENHPTKPENWVLLCCAECFLPLVESCMNAYFRFGWDLNKNELGLLHSDHPSFMVCFRVHLFLSFGVFGGRWGGVRKFKLSFLWFLD